jgi:preprotein translocase subunit YajC
MQSNLLNVFLLGAPSGGGSLMDYIPLVLIVVVFYMFMIRPQLKKQKEQKKFRESLAKGDKVTTIGGLHGKVTEVKDNVVMLEVAPNVIFKVEKSAVSAEFSADSGIQNNAK